MSKWFQRHKQKWYTVGIWIPNSELIWYSNGQKEVGCHSIKKLSRFWMFSDIFFDPVLEWHLTLCPKRISDGWINQTTFYCTVGIWNWTIWNQETFEIWTFWSSDFKWSGFQMLGFNYGYSFSSNHSKTGPFKIRTFLSGFKMFFDKMAAICPNFKWLGLWISGPIEIQTICNSTSVWPFEIQTSPDFRCHCVLKLSIEKYRCVCTWILGMQ